MYVSTK